MGVLPNFLIMPAGEPCDFAVTLRVAVRAARFFAVSRSGRSSVAGPVLCLRPERALALRRASAALCRASAALNLRDDPPAGAA